ncbi:CHASE domain-containing protein [Undibacterium sp. RuRC25W]|uniref:CHASE domain-containing protein n=1 Tax=Undibacterium sp. RuRC25W TaxID=3413047 RepID=UPI003BEF8474
MSQIQPQAKTQLWVYRYIRLLKKEWLSSLILIAGLSISYIVWTISLRNHEDVDKARFVSTSELISTSLAKRMNSNEQILRGGAALFSMNNSTSREQWRTYVSSLRLDETSPGIQGVGFVLRVPDGEKATHTAKIRAEGYPEYTIYPAAPRDEYMAVIYLEPFWGRNLRAFGYDLASEEVRRSALDQARDTGEPALTGLVKLLQEGKDGNQAGFLLFIPIYKNGLPRGSVEERRESLLGYVYSPFRVEDMMRNVLVNVDSSVGVEVFDGKEIDNKNLLFSSVQNNNGVSPRYVSSRQMDFEGKSWTLRFTSLPTFEALSNNVISHMIFAAGIAVTILLTFVVTNLAATRNSAFGMAKEMTTQLSHSENALRAVLDSAADGIVRVDGNGIVKSVNLAAEHIFGLSADKLSDFPLQQIIDGMDVNKIEETLNSYGNAGSAMRSARVESFGIRSSGDQFPLAVSLSQFNQNDEINYSLMVRDISDDKMAEAILQLRLTAIEAATNGIVIADMRMSSQPIIYSNPAFERITGYTASEMLGMNCRILQADDRFQLENVELSQAIQQGRECKVLIRNYRKDGSLFWNDLSVAPVIDQDGVVTHYVGSLNDVTDRVLAEENLRIRSMRLDAICTLSPDGVVAFDANGKLTNVNPAFLEMTGFSNIQLTNLTMDEFDTLMASLADPAHAYVSSNEENKMNLVLDSDDDLVQASQQMVYLCSPRTCILIRSIRTVAPGSLEQVIYFRDVTRETEIDRIKSEFLSTAAHELRTPMASIFGFSELLLRRKYDEVTQKDLLSTINRQAGIMINLINELLDLARIEARAGKDFKFSVQAIAPIVENAVAALLVNNDPRRINVNISDNLPDVKVDAEKIGQSLMNVLSNAYKYSPNGGDIDLFVLSEDHEGVTEIGLRVTDQGIGLTPAQMSRLFERFFRADPSGNIPGTGLGMCIVKEIIELHGGRVDVQSEKDVGTTVTLWLPVAQQEELLAA